MKARRMMSNNERRAFETELKLELAEWDKKHYNELDALVLWVLHSEFGFGEKRLKQFHEAFVRNIGLLLKRYEMEGEDDVWLCTYKLKQAGIDISEWNEKGDTSE